jgi:hypothetical protein
MSDPLDDLLQTLRSPARPAEHTRRDADVDAMHHALLDASEPAMPRPAARRRLPVATVIAAGILGFAGVAAAGPGGFFSADAPDPSTSTVPETSTAPSTTETTIEPTTTEATSTTESVSTTVPGNAAEPATSATEDAPDGTTADAPLVDDPDTEFDETQCADGNHGRTVSSVAQSVEPGPDHGAAVSEAAQSSCGKQGDEADDDSTPEVTTAGVPTTKPHGKPDDVGSQGDEHRNDRATTEHPPADPGKPDGAGKPADPGKPDSAGKPDDAGKPKD